MTLDRQFVWLLMAATVLAMPAFAADEPIDPLSLQSAPPEEALARSTGERKFVEAALGSRTRSGSSAQVTSRLALDVAMGFRLTHQWRATLSDRLVILDPPGLANDHRVVNSLREAYVSWSAEDGEMLFEAGRVNVRNGPAYGYNPTDFLRAGTLRSVTTYDPAALRENRLGTFMVRAQRLLGSQTFALALAPKLAKKPDDGSFSLDLGSTNDANRVLGVWSAKLSERINTQALFYSEQGRGRQLGISATALFGDSVVAYAEWARARDVKLINMLRADTTAKIGAQRWASGLTLTLPAKTSLTLEYGYNGFGLNEFEWRFASVAGRDAFAQLLGLNQGRQEQFSRQAWTIHASKQGAIWRSLDVSALLRYNMSDHSYLGWIEARHHWHGVDVAVQLHRAGGKPISEYGVLAVMSSVQALVTWYF